MGKVVLVTSMCLNFPGIDLRRNTTYIFKSEKVEKTRSSLWLIVGSVPSFNTLDQSKDFPIFVE